MQHLKVLLVLALCLSCLLWSSTARITTHHEETNWAECETTVLPQHKYTPVTIQQYNNWKVTMNKATGKHFDFASFAENAAKFMCQAIRYLQKEGPTLYVKHLDNLMTTYQVPVGSAIFSFFDSPFAATPASVYRGMFMTNLPRSHEEYRAVSGANKYYDWTQVRPDLVRAVPEDFDWRNEGRVTSPRSQSVFGSCWAFSAAQTLEGQLKTIGVETEKLSVELTAECDNYTTNVYFADCMWFGGLPSLAMKFIKDHGGYPTDNAWPYARDEITDESRYRPCMPTGYDKKLCGDHDDLYCKRESTHGQGAEQWCDPKLGPKPVINVGDIIDIPKNETLIHKALLQYGPLSVAMRADDFGYYKSGIIDYDCGDFLDHALLITGVGFDKTENKPFWSVKNSWGEEFGESGYLRIVMGKNMCGLAGQVVAATGVKP